MESLSGGLIVRSSDLLHRLSPVPSNIKLALGILVNRDIHRILRFDRPAGNDLDGRFGKDIPIIYGGNFSAFPYYRLARLETPFCQLFKSRWIEIPVGLDGTEMVLSL